MSLTDLFDADLHGANLSCMDLDGKTVCADLSYAYLRRVILSSTDLRGANLSGAITGYIRLSGEIACTDLSEAYISASSQLSICDPTQDFVSPNEFPRYEY